MSHTGGRGRLIVLLWLFALFAAGLAASPKRTQISFEFPQQNVALGSPAQVRLSISSLQGWQSGKAYLTVSPYTRVAPGSKASDLRVDHLIELRASNGTTPVSVPLTVARDGEYLVRIDLELQVGQKLERASRTLAVLAEGGRVWFGADTLQGCIRERILFTIRADYPASSTGQRSQLFNTLMADAMRGRAEKAHRPAGIPGDFPSLTPAGAIQQGDPLAFQASWRGPDNTGASTSFPMDGVRIEVIDVAGQSNTIAGFIIDGKFTFTAPRDDFRYRTELEARFPGVDGNGAIDLNGNGIGSFSVTSNGIDNNPGPVYREIVPEGETVYESTEAGAGMTLASVWSVFHGSAEIIRQAKSQLNADKRAGFSVVFPGSGTFLRGSDVHLVMGDRYDWDIIGHELGHAISRDEDLVAAGISPGGFHNGANQFDLSGNNDTKGNKQASLGLAFDEGLATWFGVSILQRSSFAGRFQNVGDWKITDTDDQFLEINLERNEDADFYGEDTEKAIQALLWDLGDSFNEPNSRTSGLDSLSLGLSGPGGLWNIMDDALLTSVTDFWVKGFLPEEDITRFLQPGAGAIDRQALQRSLNAALTFTEFGLAPFLGKPRENQMLDLRAASGPTFEWRHEQTGDEQLELNKFTLAVYSQDLSTLLFQQPDIESFEYTLQASDLMEIQDALQGRDDAAVVAAVVGTSDKLSPFSGPYLSNPVQLLIQDFNRAVVMVVDSSGSNLDTDPTNLRVDASQETLRRLKSLMEAAAEGTTPDLAGAIDFDSIITILSNLADPDDVIPTLEAIDSQGGTDIASGIDAAASMIENVQGVIPIVGVFRERAAICVFTDGMNNAGPLPVIQAIAAATLKGIRVHYGFLRPFAFAPAARSSDPRYRGPDPFLDLVAQGLPPSIEQAVLQSGGVFAIIHDAASQIAFVRQIEAAGFTNADRTNPGGQTVAGQTETADELAGPQQVRSFLFNGRAGENARVIVDTRDGNQSPRFQPFLKIFHPDGSVLAVDDDSDADGFIELPLTLPADGDYVAEVFSQDGRIGLFTIFVDVANVVGQPPLLEIIGNIALNNQTGLLEQRVAATNAGAIDIAGFGLSISGLPEGARVFNASRQEGDSFIVEFGNPLPVGESVDLVIEYYSPRRSVGLAPIIRAVLIPPLAGEDPAGPIVNVTRIQLLEDGSVLIEFSTEPGRLYFVQYSDDLGATWITATPPVQATGTSIQWIDNGPPKTISAPTSNRVYRAVLSEQPEGME